MKKLSITKKLFLIAVVSCIFVSFSIVAFAQNPFITNLYLADPSARVMPDGRLYVYPSHDIEPGQGCDLMDQYHVYSTADMVNWTDHGEILRASQVPWGRPEGGFMWAPDCIYKNGTYYYYFPHPSGTDWGSTWKIGIATSTSPASGFTVQGYIPGLESLIDPNVFIDDDGQAYFYYGGGGVCKGGKLNANMMQIDGSMQSMTGLVDFHEATWVFKRNGIYYLTYADNHSDATGDNRLAYATSSNPLGPWTYKGIFMDPTDSFCAHGSVVQYKGEWYSFYFNSSISHNDWLRSICVDKLYFNADGTIQKVVQTTAGVPPVGGSPQPDFVVTDITCNPANPTVGETVTFNAVVRNQGSGAGAPGVVAFKVDGTQVATSANNTTQVQAGTAITISATTTWTVTSGTHTLTATADNSNTAVESNETNNSYSESLVPTQLPCQIEAENYRNMSGIQTESCSEGGLNTCFIDTNDWMDYVVYVPTTGTYTVNARVASPNNGGAFKMQNNGTDLCTFNVPNTGAWQNWTTLSQNITLNAGVQTLRAYVTAGGFNINYFNITSTGTSKPDMIVTDITYSPASPVAGNAVTFSAVVKNQGTAAGAAGIVAFKVDGTQVSTSANSTTSIAAGGTLTITASGTWTATNGTHTLNAVVDNSNTTSESNESNNSYSESLTIGSTGQPDLIVTDITWSPASPVAGNAVTFSATIKNQGTGATPAGTINGVAFQIDGGGTTIWSDNNTTSIAAGASITVTANGGTAGSTWTALSGTHSILAWVDDVNRMAESNESNNQFTKSITVGSGSGNLAQGKSISANNYTQTYVATNANDGNVNTYWEGAANSYPNTLTVDLGSSQTVGKVVIKLNASWGTRTQTLSVLSSTDNTNYTTRVASNTYTFNPSSSNIVTITFTQASARYVRLNFTANSGATAGQTAEFEVYSN